MIPNAVFVVVRGPSDPLWLSLESKPDGHWHTWCDVTARDKRGKGAKSRWRCYKERARASECKQ